MTRGLSNWKDGTLGIRNHERCASHIEAVQVMITIPSSHKDNGEQLSSTHAHQKIKYQHKLYHLRIWFLCRQGLALRGNGSECDSNFNQLITLKDKEDSNLTNWLKRKEYVYTSADIQNELIEIMGGHVLESIIEEKKNNQKRQIHLTRNRLL